MNNNFYSTQVESESIELGKIFRFLLMQSKLIILIVFIASALAYFHYSVSTKKYLITSLLQYEPVNQNIFDPSKTLQMASLGSSSDITNLISLYKSRSNLIKVIKDLNLNINIKDLYVGENIDINIISDNLNNYDVYNLKLSFTKNGYSLLDENQNELQVSDYGKQILYKDLKISIKSANLKQYRTIDINYVNPETMYNSLKSALDVTSDKPANYFFKNQGLITVSYTSDDIVKGKEIINYANSIFLKQRIYAETEKSRRAIEFIDKNIISIEQAVRKNKNQLKEFRERNKSIDVTLEIEAIVKKMQNLDQSLGSIDIEIAKAKEIYTPNNPIYINLLNKKTLTERQMEIVLSEIEMMPKEQQDYIDLYNELQISQSLFEELESRRLGFSILKASTIGDIRVIDDAYVSTLVSPKLFYVFFVASIAFIFACLIAIIRGFNFLPLSNPAEIFDNNISIPIVGVIPKMKDSEINEKDIAFESSIESLIVNINSIQNDQIDKNLITISSPTPFNGKSTVSINLAEGYSKLGKKVLLVDNDLKRGSIGKKYNVETIAEDTFNSIDESSIEKFYIKDNLYLVPRVRGLIDTFQFLYSRKYQDKIAFFKEYFDIVIFDTGPILSVSDSSILVQQSDINIVVARHGVSQINELKQVVENYKQTNTQIDGIIYNAYAKPKSYYGVYSLYGNYSYQYYADKYLDESYNYEKKD